MTSVLRQKGNLDTETHAQREDDMKTQGEDAHLQTKECLWL